VISVPAAAAGAFGGHSLHKLEAQASGLATVWGHFVAQNFNGGRRPDAEGAAGPFAGSRWRDRNRRTENILRR